MNKLYNDNFFNYKELIYFILNNDNNTIKRFFKFR